MMLPRRPRLRDVFNVRLRFRSLLTGGYVSRLHALLRPSVTMIERK